ncbi:MAG TPA: tRNA threonylcarbamoyladenosine dehydratase [Polyangia bacterium]
MSAVPPDDPAPDLRFERVGRLLGAAALARLARAHVVVVGLGGVGSFAAEALARSGVGRLTLVDGDPVAVTNVNRQLHALAGTIGEPKAVVLAARLARINPAARIEACPERYGPATAARLVPARVSYIVDAIDHVTSKLHLLARCVQGGIPVVTSLGAAGRTDPTRVRVDDLGATAGDPFGRVVRKYLRQRHGVRPKDGAGITAVWSTEPLTVPPPAAAAREVAPDHPALGPLPGKTRARTPVCLGSVVFVTGVFGLIAASVVVRALAGAEPES